MKRIIYLVCRLFFYIPKYLYLLHYYSKHINDTSFEERFNFAKDLIHLINNHSRVNIHCFGKENIPSESGFLITPNHQGLFDPLILFETLDQPFKAVLKKELLEVPVLKKLIAILEYLAIDRGNLRGSMKVIKQVSNELSEGMNYVIFPEGTRCKRQNEMLEFKGGTFKSIIDAKGTILPVALIDCYRVFDDNSIKEVDAQVHYLKPIPYEEYKDMRSTEIATMVQERIKACIVENENRYKKA